ncbi:MAG: hypothetical protein KDA27_23015 [Candidatus Eisenbacteria bacterium]|uniref:Uncharacterized protein n=1 Tax=Eiseniibacteriota bacterium TaxID=2212470 RepID=A0A956NH19_UNCEI|nr:hypothetical protein [Candidatus Eisenbacteria bacterium]MCB9466462.1 hypothetical protein [Candidatus Eisenbacteria bacterium]
MIDSLGHGASRSRAVRVAGILDTISATRNDVELTLKDGASVSARLETHDNERLKSLFGSRVVVSGMARFGTSGELLTIDVEHLGPVGEGDVLFERVPSSPSPPGRPVVTLRPQDVTTGVSAFFGTWPGDESDEELLAALDAIR